MSTISDSNLISSISVLGLAKKNNGEDLTLEVVRTRPELPSFPPGPVYYDPADESSHHFVCDADQDDDVDWAAFKPTTAEPIQAEVQPSQQGGVHLKLRIGKRLYAGRYSWVHDVHIISPLVGIPPLVAKFARQTRGRRLSEEAGAYEVLHSLQGIILPRCYGYFRSFVNLQQMSVIPWDPQCKLPRTTKDLDIYNMPNSSASLNIVLLEKLGRPLSDFDTSHVVVSDLQQELLSMLMAASDLGIIHTDITPRNILEASLDVTRSSRTAQGVPESGRWRLIDWEDFDVSYSRNRQSVMDSFEDRIQHLIETHLQEHTEESEMEIGEEDDQDELKYADDADDVGDGGDDVDDEDDDVDDEDE